MTDRSDPARALADAMWQLLNDMGNDGLSVCGAAKAQARVAYEPFREEPEEELGIMRLHVAKALLANVEAECSGRRSAWSPAAVAEHDLVTTSAIVATDEGREVPPGATGTVLRIVGGGAAFVVEFDKPVAGIATVWPAAIGGHTPSARTAGTGRDAG